jgi:hypothetical protein
MNPCEKYGSEFLCRPFTFRHADGRHVHCQDVAVCIVPKNDPSTTLTYAWEVFRELATWVLEELKDRHADETFRIIIAWSKTVREHQGHIIKVWGNLDRIREIATCVTPEDCSAIFGAGFTPLPNWQKDVFNKSNNA